MLYNVFLHMFSEISRGCPDKVLYSAVYNPQENQKLIVALDGIQVVFGLPKLYKNGMGTFLTIPNTPHVFKVNRLEYLTRKPNYKHSFILYDKVILLCHGKRDHDDPTDWKLADSQDPLKLVQIINNLGRDYPRVDAIVSCRSIAPTVDKKSYRHPDGYRSVQNVIIQKFGTVSFVARLENNHITAIVTSDVSDFYKIDKKRRINNLRKSHKLH